MDMDTYWTLVLELKALFKLRKGKNMSILEKIKDASMVARKAKNKETSKALTCLIGEINIIGTNDGKRETTDAEAEKVLTKFVKGVKENLELATDRRLVNLLKKELILYESFLPEQMTESELNDLIKTIVSSLEKPNIGLIMKELKSNHSGLYDGKIASRLIKENL